MKLSIRKILDHYFVNVLADNADNDNIYCQCPFHKGTGKTPQNFSINRHSGLWICFSRRCGSGGIIKFVQKKENCGFSEAKKLLARHFLGSGGPSWSTLAQSSAGEVLRKPQGALRRLSWSPNLSPMPFNHPFLAKRGIGEGTAEHFRLAVDYSDLAWVWFPVYQKKKLRGFTKRSILYKPLKKWKHGQGFQAGRLLYNFDNAADSSWVIVTEGPLDVLRFWDLGFKNAVALFGTTLGRGQKVLIKSTWRKILVAMDGDVPGREAATNIAEQLKGRATYLGVLTFPKDKDPGDLTNKEEFIGYCRENIEVLISRKEGITWADAGKKWRS